MQLRITKYQKMETLIVFDYKAKVDGKDFEGNTGSKNTQIENWKRFVY